MLDLNLCEGKIFSQNGEDGIIEALLKVVNCPLKYYVEFGVGDGSECNTRRLREYFNYEGLMFDVNHNNPEINLYQEYLTIKNIIHIFKEYYIPNEFTLLSVDTDFYDFYLLSEILKQYQPKIEDSFT